MSYFEDEATNTPEVAPVEVETTPEADEVAVADTDSSADVAITVEATEEVVETASGSTVADDEQPQAPEEA